MRKKRLWALIIISQFLIWQLAAADELLLQRSLFLQAKSALKQDNGVRFRLLSALLYQYPLYPYLRYDELLQHPDRISEQQAADFLQRYAGTPLAVQFRHNWLLALAIQQRWSLFLKYYQPTMDSGLQCYSMQALAMTGQRDTAFHLLPAIWLKVDPTLVACQPIFAIWKQAGGMTPNLIWQRLEGIMASKDTTLASNLVVLLSPAQRAEAKLWQRVHAQPDLVVTQPNLFLPYRSHTKEIALDGIILLAKKEPLYVAEQWPLLLERYGLDETEQQIVVATVGISLARAHHPAASDWLARIDPLAADGVAHEWQIRNAIASHDWSRVSDLIAKLSPSERNTSCWQYWLARSLAAQHQLEEARTIYHTLANSIGYYGLLASYQLQTFYQPLTETSSISPSLLRQLEKLPAIQRARELYYLGLLGDARREWEWALKGMDNQQLYAAAYLAEQWNWYDRAIATLAKTPYQNNFAIRFPLAYPQQVMASASKLALNPAWVYAIIRQESAFMPDAKSSVGAVGLMQLMPATAKLLDRGDYSLVDANVNIRLGSTYLKQLLGWYNGAEVPTTAAYNVGPGALKKWLPLRQSLDDDVWIEVLPWQETRNYLKNVLFATAIYQQRLAQESMKNPKKKT